MHNWFECKVSFEKMLENGMQKKVTEPYLVDALSFTEAESRIIEEIRPFITGEFTVTDIKRARISELLSHQRRVSRLSMKSASISSLTYKSCLLITLTAVRAARYSCVSCTM